MQGHYFGGGHQSHRFGSWFQWFSHWTSSTSGFGG